MVSKTLHTTLENE